MNTHNKFNTDINKHKAKIYDQYMYTLIIILKKLLFFFIAYKNEQKEHKL